MASLRSRTVGFPESGSDLGLSSAGLPGRGEAQAAARIHPCQRRFTCGLAPAFSPCARFRLGVRGRAGVRGRQVPRAPLHATGVTPPSSLLLAHAPDQNPPAGSGVPRTAGLCRLSLLPAGRWPFPVLSPRSMHGCLDPCPAAPLQCTCPFLPEGLRPHLTCQRFGTLETRRCATLPTGKVFRGCSHSVMFRLPCLLDPQVAPTTKAPCLSGGRAVYVTPNPCGRPT